MYAALLHNKSSTLCKVSYASTSYASAVTQYTMSECL